MSGLGLQRDKLVFNWVSRGEPNAVLRVEDIVLTINEDVDGDGISD